MTPVPVTDADRTRLAAVRRVLSAVWCGLQVVSHAVIGVLRGRVVDLGVGAVAFAIYREDSHVLGIAAAGAWFLLRVGLFVRFIQRGRR